MVVPAQVTEQGMSRPRACLASGVAHYTLRYRHFARDDSEAQLRPYIVTAAFARTGTTLLLLEVQNTGKSPAEKLRLQLDKDFYQHAEKREDQNLAKLPAFTQTIECLAPGVKLQFVLGVGHKVLGEGVEDLCPKVFGVQAAYSFAGAAYTEATTVDLRPLMRSAVIHDPVAEELEKLRQSLGNLLKG